MPRRFGSKIPTEKEILFALKQLESVDMLSSTNLYKEFAKNITELDKIKPFINSNTYRDLIKEQNKINLNDYINELDTFADYTSHSLHQINDNYDDIKIVFEPKQISLQSPDNEDVKINISESDKVMSISNLVGEISFEDCADFINHLSNYPMLGLKHSTGEQIYQAINSFKKTSIKNIELFRIRESTSKKTMRYTENEMFQPQYKSPKQNRFSMAGLNPLYLCSSLDVAKLETEITALSKYTYIRINLTNKLQVLDITDSDIDLFNYCHKKAEKTSVNLYTEYLLPNFVADCAKACGFDGIIYNSVHNDTAKNYVLFEVGKRDFKVLEYHGFNYE